VHVVRNKMMRLGQLLTHGVRYPDQVQLALGSLYRDIAHESGGIPHVSFEKFFAGLKPHAVCLYDFVPRDGNLDVNELLFVCNCVALFAPRVVFEVGTFDGNTTLQIAANAPPSTAVYTLDLPDDVKGNAVAKIDPYDAVYIDGKATLKRRYLDTPYGDRVVQKFGNSLEVDFAEVLDGKKADLVLIDAGHSYECVRNDSEKALRLLSPGGLVIWDDYSANWPGVYDYLNELGRELALLHVADTQLVVYRDNTTAAP
jgi:predicted O-methyltransferase YrrM